MLNTTTQETSVQHHHKILIVDDHPTNVALLEDILGEDYLLATATSGEEALAIAPDFQPALVLMDIMMPGLDGYETCRRLRAQATLRHTKIILVSAKAMLSERLQGYEAGADDYITKPFDEDELLAKVRVYLRLKSVEEVERLKSDLLVLLSHETRTPLNGLLPALASLRSEPDMASAERQLLLDMAYQSARRLQYLLERVMALSAMKSGQWTFLFTPVDLGDVVRAAVCAVASHAAARQVQIEQRLPDAAMTMLDPEQMLSVLTTMLENAIRFSDIEGVVVVSVARHADRFCVTVTDQGDGIDPDILPRVFEGFVHTDLAHHSEGSGLSLALARQIILAHQGTIAVESTKGLGTTFTIWLPRRTAVDD
jgi:two-component system sensor histidine kinase/response regulator